MQFSVLTTEKSGILQACERYTRKGDAGITGNTTLLADFTNYVNVVNRELWHIIFKAYGGWQYEDGNQTDLPASTTTLTADQDNYALPASALSVRGIEIKDTGGIWHQLEPITEEQIREGSAFGEFEKTSSVPKYYQLIGQTVRIFPAANWTQAASFKVFYDRGSVSFLTSDGVKEPGFVSEYHDAVPLGASALWYEIYSPTDVSAQIFRQKYEQRKIDIRDFYQTKWTQMFPPRMRVRDAIRDAI